MTFIMFLISPILGLISVIESFAKYKNLNKWIVITVTVIVFFFLGYSVRLTNVNADLVSTSAGFLTTKI
ncbi:hypothetical protein JCM15457_1183 [Liquorilactobacillus sucicola DSM 21376 = JCM 15457]|uniref:hypothetical protein n=1 Tax=Liquorilactobacillus sucicola TaxID=519050 RepID=UPI0004365101|nr:hypothetical protein [Liquorilactobacillus sucicola]GAJ26265.1 hypothetical protein JCM15457_1183 [Liquorilactobacillus sucicola DSM 21376 = JCM 15457]